MKKLLLIVTAILTITASADAKWWIFGKSNGEVGLKYLYVNAVSAEEAGPKIKIFKETLGTDGLVKINGKASAGKGSVGSVRISLDDKATWQDIKFADNGTFEYSFKPDPGKAYAMLLEVTDTAGKTNKVEDTRKEITLSDESIQAKVKETLDAMFTAYNAENLQKFMGYVGDDFAGDKAILERAVKRDFDALSSINLRYTANNISAGAQGRVFVSVTYNRMVFVNKTGATSQDTGSTEFVFDSNEGKLSLFSMKQPLMFGLSDAENVATGKVLGGDTFFVLDDSGNIGGGKLLTITCSGAGMALVPFYIFSTETSGCHPQDGMGDLELNDTGHVTTGNGALVKHFPGKTLASLTAAQVQDPTGYASGSPAAAEGDTFGVLKGGKYYAMEIVTFDMTAPYSDTIKVKAF